MELRAPAEAAMAIRLGVQVVVATVMASVISLCALGLALLVKFMQAHDAPDWMVLGTLGLEIFLWAADVVCFVLFVTNEVIGFCVGLWRERSWR